MRRAGCLAVAAMLLALAGCGDDGSGLPLLGAPGTSAVEGSTTPTTGTDTTVTTEAAAGTTTTTTAGTTTTTTTLPFDPFAVDNLLALEPGELPDLTGTAAIIGTTPDRGLAAALTAEMESTGLDLTGTRIEVLPVTGTGESLLVFWIDDTATALADDDEAADTLISTLLASPIVDGASITRLVINYRSEDDDGPFVLTATAEVAVMRAAMDSGESLTEEQMLMQFTRVEGS